MSRVYLVSHLGAARTGLKFETLLELRHHLSALLLFIRLVDLLLPLSLCLARLEFSLGLGAALLRAHLMAEEDLIVLLLPMIRLELEGRAAHRHRHASAAVSFHHVRSPLVRVSLPF